MEKLRVLRKKWFIKRELKNKYKLLERKNKQYLNVLVNALMRGSEISHKQVLLEQQAVTEDNNKTFYKDIQTLIENHYKDETKKLKRENKKLEHEKKQKDKKLAELRQKVRQTVSV